MDQKSNEWSSTFVLIVDGPKHEQVVIYTFVGVDGPNLERVVIYTLWRNECRWTKSRTIGHLECPFLASRYPTLGRGDRIVSHEPPRGPLL